MRRCFLSPVVLRRLAAPCVLPPLVPQRRQQFTIVAEAQSMARTSAPPSISPGPVRETFPRTKGWVSGSGGRLYHKYFTEFLLRLGYIFKILDGARLPMGQRDRFER